MRVVRNVKVKRITLVLLIGMVFLYQYATVVSLDRHYSGSTPVELPAVQRSEHRLPLVQVHTNVSVDANDFARGEVGLEGVKNDNKVTSLQGHEMELSEAQVDLHSNGPNNDTVTSLQGASNPTKSFPSHEMELSKAQADLHSNRPIDSSLALQWIKGSQYFDERIKQLYLSCHATVSRDSSGVFGQCKNFTDMRFIDDGSRVVALPSYPGSGSTWTRMALEQATGIYTGSVYCDPELKSKGLLGEKLSSSNVLAVKTHYPDKDLFVPYEEYYDLSKFKSLTAAIFIIRNPLDSFVAQWNWKHGGHVNYIQPAFFGNNPEWKRFIKNSVEHFVELVRYWLEDAQVSVLVIRYEDMVTDLATQLTKMLDFLEVDYSQSDIDCVVNSKLDKFHRNKTTTFDPYTPSDKKIVWESFMSTKPLLNRYNINYELNDTL